MHCTRQIGEFGFQRRRWVAAVGVALGAFVVLGGNLSAEELPPPQLKLPEVIEAPAAECETKLAPPAEIDAILKLRQLIGSPFAGTVLEAAPEMPATGSDEFARILAEVARHAAATLPAASCSTSSACATCRACTAACTDTLTHAEVATGSSSVVNPEQLKKVRRAARRLALAAEDLEQCARYIEADSLRSMADSLRQAARAAE